MKLQDPVRWADQEMELQVDEYSRLFLNLFVKWMDLAEEGWGPILPRLRAALPILEKAESVILSMEVVGQMLLMSVDHWVHGPDIDEGLTPLERRMMQQMAAIKEAALQESATL